MSCRNVLRILREAAQSLQMAQEQRSAETPQGLICPECRGEIKERDNTFDPPPKSTLGKAIGYLKRQWEKLRYFLKDPKVWPDNNRWSAMALLMSCSLHLNLSKSWQRSFFLPIGIKSIIMVLGPNYMRALPNLSSERHFFCAQPEIPKPFCKPALGKHLISVSYRFPQSESIVLNGKFFFFVT